MIAFAKSRTASLDAALFIKTFPKRTCFAKRCPFGSLIFVIVNVTIYMKTKIGGQ